jgi:2-hydroxy-6-oxo-6-(2'-carboxyphenyl)-hexa-2,4-dienoate hydrolase
MSTTATLPQSFWVSLLGSETRYYDAKGNRTRVVEAGSGPAVLFLHGLSGHAEAFSRNIIPFSEHFRACAVDMLGHGFTAKPDVTYDIATLANHVLDVMDSMGLERASFVGQSLGGWVGAWIALEHPERIEKLLLATGAGLQPTPTEGTRSVTNQVRQVTQAALENPTREGVRKRLEWLMRRPETVTDELVEVRYRVFTESREMLQRVVDTTARANDDFLLTPDRLQRITVPTFVYWTRYNPTTPWETAEKAVAFLPNVRFEIMEEAGHWPMFERPDEFNRQAIDFFLNAK